MDRECRTTCSVATMGSIGLKCLWNCSWEFVDSAQPHSPFIFNTSPPILVSGSVILLLVLSSVGLMLVSGFQSGIQACFLLAGDLCDIAPARCVFFLSWILSCMESPTSWSLTVVWSHHMSWTTCRQTPAVPEVCALVCPLQLVPSLTSPIQDFSVFSPATRHRAEWA